MKVLNRFLLIVFSGSVLVACGGDDSDGISLSDVQDNPSEATARVRVVHAASDAPDVNAGLNGGGQVSGLAFADATGFLTVAAGTYDVNVDGILPGDTTQTVIDASGMDAVAVAEDTETSIYAIGKVGDASLMPIVITAPDIDPAAGELRAQVVHAAADAPSPVDIYVTAPSASLTDTAVTPLATLAFGESADPVTVPAGNYRIRVTPAGDNMTVAFDSGTVGLSGDLQVAAIDNVGPTAGLPVRLLVMPDGSDAFVLQDQGAEAAIRAAHLSSDTGAVDVAANGNYTPPLFEDATFPNVTGFENVASAAYDVDVALANTATSAVGVDGLTLAQGTWYTAYAMGLSMGSPSLEIVTSEDDLRSVATEAKLRVVHAASQVPTLDGIVDVYLEDSGSDCSALGTSSPLLTAFPYTDITDFQSLAADDYVVCVTPSGMTTAAIGPVALSLAAGDVITVIARDQSGGGFTAQVLDDSPAP
jgi:hypothetical protein